jgi:tungstate transport system permease protein
MTTAIAMLHSMGDYSQAIALGMVLLLLSFLVNNLVYGYKEV